MAQHHLEQHRHQHAIAPCDSADTGDMCDADCGAIRTERNRYFTGKYMAARDFADEQAYFVSRHRLHNRLLHGWGIVCGLEVERHPIDECATHFVVVNPGIAIDCCGRELVLEQKTVVKVWEQPANNNGARPPAPANGTPPGAKPEATTTENPTNQATTANGGSSGTKPESPRFLLYLRYCEELFGHVPALYDEDACGPTHSAGPRRKEANRVRETAHLAVCRWEHDDPACWPNQRRTPGEEQATDEASKDAAQREQEYIQSLPCDDCTSTPDKPELGCLQPNCACHGWVPLALITADGQAIIDEQKIEREGRRYINAPAQLTHIVYYNWTHGGTIKLSHLRDTMKRELRVFFDRKLLVNVDEQAANTGESPEAQSKAANTPPVPVDVDNPQSPAFRRYNRTGINDHTFFIERHSPAETGDSVEVLFNDQERPRLENGCVAVLPIAGKWFEGRRSIGNSWLHVKLRCDFILDCREIPVDGDHLRGRYPTGNGTPGGLFESWFYIIDDLQQSPRSGVRRT